MTTTTNSPHVNNTETEVKIRVSDLRPVAIQLESIGAVMSAPRVLETNLRLDTLDHAFSRTRKVLRLRQDTRARLTYKEDPPPEMVEESAGDGISRRTEIELEISDLEAMRLILEKLGYLPMWIYEKYRTTYQIQECEIVLDELPFGQFIEIEGTPAHIESVLQALELQTAPRLLESYSGLFLRVKQKLGLTFNDLTFANFENIQADWDLIDG